MRWELAEEQEALRDAFGHWLENVARVEQVREWFENSDESSFAQRLDDEGWSLIGVDEERGGQGGGLAETVMLAESMGASGAPNASWLAAMVARAAIKGEPGEALPGAQEMNRAVLAVPADAACDEGAVFSEIAGGKLSGSVPWVLGAARAEHFLVPVKIDGRTALYLVKRAESGVEVDNKRLVDQSRSVGDVRFHQATADLVVPDAGGALARAAAYAAVLVAADTIGAAGRMLDLSVEYSKQRHQFGVPIGSFQAVKHAAAGIMVSVESARTAIYFAAASLDEGGAESLMHAAAVKAQVTHAGAEVADTALTMHGAIGYTWEYELQRYYKRAKLNETLFGTPAQWNERLACALLD